MKSKMLLCDRAVGQVPRQGAVLGQGLRQVSRQGGVVRQLNQDRVGCREDKGCLWAVVGFYKMRTARAHMAAPVSTGSPWHREHGLVPKSHRM